MEAVLDSPYILITDKIEIKTKRNTPFISNKCFNNFLVNKSGESDKNTFSSTA